VSWCYLRCRGVSVGGAGKEKLTLMLFLSVYPVTASGDLVVRRSVHGG